MSTFPTTTEELDEYISAYMTAHIAEAIETVTDAVVRQAVREYMADYGAALESNGSDGDVPLVADNELDADHVTMPLVRTDAQGIPASFIQARVSALGKVAAMYVSSSDRALDIVQQTGSDVSIGPNVLNVWPTPVASLRITFAAGVPGKANEYMMQFTCPSGQGTSLTLPQSVEWMNGETLDAEPGWTYQVSIVNNLAIYSGWEAASV